MFRTLIDWRVNSDILWKKDITVEYILSTIELLMCVVHAGVFQITIEYVIREEQYFSSARVCV